MNGIQATNLIGIQATMYDCLRRVMLWEKNWPSVATGTDSCNKVRLARLADTYACIRCYYFYL